LFVLKLNFITTYQFHERYNFFEHDMLISNKKVFVHKQAMVVGFITTYAISGYHH
jgi:hypothetical protein